MPRFIESDREVCRRIAGLPCRDNFTLLAIDHCHLMRVRNVHKNPWTVPLEDKSFRMPCQIERSDALRALRIDHTDSTAAESDIGLPSRHVAAHVVGVVLEINVADQ